MLADVAAEPAAEGSHPTPRSSYYSYSCLDAFAEIPYGPTGHNRSLS
jgi:hypothetical protein